MSVWSIYSIPKWINLRGVAIHQDFSFLLLLHVCVRMLLILLASSSLLLLTPFLSFFGLLFSTLWWLLFYLFLVIHHIKDNLLPSELFLPDKISYSLCQLAFLYFPLVKTYLEHSLENFSEGYKVIIFHVFFFFNFERGLTWHYTTLSENALDRRNDTMIRTL